MIVVTGDKNLGIEPLNLEDFVQHAVDYSKAKLVRQIELFCTPKALTAG